MTDAVTLTQDTQAVSAGTGAPGIATPVKRRIDVGHVPTPTCS